MFVPPPFMLSDFGAPPMFKEYKQQQPDQLASRNGSSSYEGGAHSSLAGNQATGAEINEQSVKVSGRMMVFQVSGVSRQQLIKNCTSINAQGNLLSHE